MEYPDVSCDLLLPRDEGCKEDKPSGKKWTKCRAQGQTALVIYGHLLMYEPAPNDFLNRMILGVLSWYDEQGEKIRGKEVDLSDPAQYEKYQRELFDLDLPFYEMLRTPFRTEDGDIYMNSLHQLLPVIPIDQDFKKSPGRAPLNGMILQFAIIWMNGSFFTDQMGPTLMTSLPSASLANAECFAVITARDLLKRSFGIHAPTPPPSPRQIDDELVSDGEEPPRPIGGEITARPRSPSLRKFQVSALAKTPT
jgi:hypothetical protein